ncbi:MAG: alpha-E domain-containing protein [Chloroflexota bacterium]|nr:alpha-E domain-containing protein [Chloroflexota bacterium]
MLCRVADDLFWLGRYVERAIAVGRLIDVTWHLELDDGDPHDAPDFWATLLGPNRQALDQAGDVHPRDVRRYLAFDRDNPNSLLSCIWRARAAAQRVREAISSEMWEGLNALHLSLADPRLAAAAEEDPHAFYKRIREGAQFFEGLAESTMARDEEWHFLCLGRYLERADNVARVLIQRAPLLLGAERPSTGDDTVRWLAVLRSCGCAEAYSRYYSMRIEPARVVEFLLLNPIFPQSVRFSLDAANDVLGAIAGTRARHAELSDPSVRAMGQLQARLKYSAVDEILEEGLEPFLTDVQHQIHTVSECVTAGYLRDEPHPGRLVAVARAAMIMAAQQQQQQRVSG